MEAHLSFPCLFFFTVSIYKVKLKIAELYLTLFFKDLL